MIEFADGIALGALLIAGMSYFRTSSLTARQNTLTEEQNTLAKRMLSIEAARERHRTLEGQSAAVRAAIEHGASDRFHLWNEGKGTARLIDARIDGEPLGHENDVLVGDEELIRTLGPGGHHRYVMAIAMGSKPRVHVSITWEDDSGVPGHWESDVGFA
jgi:hypothetical protein